MATQPRPTPDPQHLLPAAGTEDESLGRLVRELAGDLRDLLRQEVDLAKAELRESVRAVTVDTAKIGFAIGLALAGGLSMLVFMILGIGSLLGGAYWAGALITGGVLLLVGGLLTGSAIEDLKKRSRPKETVRTLREDGRFAKTEAKQLKDRVVG